MVAIDRPSGLPAYSLLISTLWGNHLRFKLGSLDEPLAVIFITDPDKPQEAPAELLQRLFGLTPAEAKLLERLVEGESLKNSAILLDISHNTARSQLRSIFEKTGTNRQAALIRLVMSTPIWAQSRNPQTAIPRLEARN